MPAPDFLLVGCGKMGSALLSGWLDGGTVAADVMVVEPAASPFTQDFAARGCAVVPSADAVTADARPSVILFAVKPQVMDGVVPLFARFASPQTLFISIAAGRTIGGLARALGDDAAIVRSMPNSPASVGRGITAACAGRHVTAEQRATCQRLLEVVGGVIWVEDESLMDAVTAVSGSGPAYVFLLAECMAAAGVDAGLLPETAMALARDTVVGAGELLARSGDAPADLRRNVTSPGGTTEAALAVLAAADGLPALMTRAVRAAVARSKALAG